MVAGPPFPRASHAALHFVAHEKNSMLPANALQLDKEFLWRGNVSAFALDRFDENRSHLFWIDQALEDFTLQKRRRFDACAGRGIAVRAAIRIRIGNVKHTGQKSAEPFALHGLGCGKRKRAERAPVKAAMECDNLVTTRMVARQLDGRFDGFRAGVSEINFLRLFAGSNRGEALRK